MENGGRNKIYKIIDYAWVIVAIFVFIASIKYLNDGTLAERVTALGIWAPLVIIILKISTLVFAPLGGTPLYLISGATYGNINGFILCFAGDCIGSALCFIIGRRYGKQAVKFFVGNGNIEKVERALGLLNNTKSFIKARIAFVSIPELLAYAAGLSKVGFWKFMLLQIPLYIPTGFILVFLGSTVTHFTAKYSILVSLLAVIIASLGIWALSKDYKKIEGM